MKAAGDVQPRPVQHNEKRVDQSFDPGWHARARARFLRRWTAILALTIALLSFGFFALLSGSHPVSPGELAAWLRGVLPTEDLVSRLLALRVPRILCAATIGATLGLAGCALQGVFRNPLADPALIGVSSGAAIGAACAILFGSAFLSAWAFAGALITVALVALIARCDGRVSVPVLVLAGVAINAIAGAALGLFAFLSDDQKLREFTFWTLGSLAAANASNVQLMTGSVALLFVVCSMCAPALNILGLSEDEARNAGYRVETVKWALIVAASLGVGVAVSFAGAIGFIGLAGPHIARMLVGADHRWAAPAAALVGATLLVGADAVARTIAAPAEVPVGVICAAMGGPFFLGLIIRNHRSLS